MEQVAGSTDHHVACHFPLEPVVPASDAA